MIKYIVLVALMVSISACNIFETRNPEEPDTGKIIFPPATSTSILIDNFTKSISEKRVDNYMDCFSNDENNSYSFTPSAEAFSAYSSYFDDWNYSDEKRYFLSLISYISSDDKIGLIFDNSKTDFVSPDSTIYTTNYTLDLPTMSAQSNSKYVGNLQLTLIPKNDGTWRILRWVDSPLKQNSDTTFPTWSFLKAGFFN